MSSKSLAGIMVCFVIAGMVFSFSCAPKTTTAPAPGTYSPPSAEESQTQQEKEQIAEQKAAAEEKRIAEQNLAAQKEAEMKAAKEKFVNQDIHFDFDSALLSREAQNILKEKARFLKNNQNATVTIEGHCDERGTSEYNMALGDRRARSAKSFLVDLGISSNRIKTISYGEERPLVPRSTPEAWAKNRRAHFVLN